MRLLKRKSKHEKEYKMDIKSKLLVSISLAVMMMFLNIIGTLVNKESFHILSLIKVFILYILAFYLISSVMDYIDDIYISSIVILIGLIISIFVYDYILKSNDFHTAANVSLKQSSIFAISMLIVNRKDKKALLNSKWGILFLVLTIICIVMTLIIKLI